MQFLKTFLVSALAAVATAQLQFTSFPPTEVTAGQGSYSLTYRTAEGKINTPVTIELRKGPSGNLGVVSTLTTSAVGGVFVFKPAKNLVDGDNYALSIQQAGSQPNYTPQFSVSGGSSSSSSSSSATGSTSSSSSSTAAPYPVAGGNSTSGVAGASAVGTGASTAVGTVGTGSPTMARNTTFSSATLAPSTSTVGGGSGSGSGSGSGASATAQQSSVSTGAATRMDSSVALVFGILGAFAYLN